MYPHVPSLKPVVPITVVASEDTLKHMKSSVRLQTEHMLFVV